MEITRYEEKHRRMWSAFLDASANGTVFHRQEFLDYHPQGRFDWQHLLFGNPGSPDAVLPAAVRPDAQGRKLFASPTGATLGGPVIKSRASLELTLEIVETLIRYAHTNHFHSIVLVTVPAIYRSVPDDTLEFALRSKGFECCAQLMHCVELESLTWPDVLQSFTASHRNTFRKALTQGLEFYLADKKADIADFYEVLSVNKAAHGTKPVHTCDEIVDLKQRLGEKIEIILARKNNQTVAGIYSVAANNRVRYTQYIADNPDYRHLEATRFLYLKLLERSREQGFRYLDLGPSVVLPVETITIARFKESLGAVGCERREWRLNLDNL